MQNDRVNASVTVRSDLSASHLLCVHTFYFQPPCDDVGGGWPSLNFAAQSWFFVKTGTKIDGDYYRDELLMELLLTNQALMMKFRSVSRTMHQLVMKLWNSLLTAPDIWLPNSPDLNAVDYCI